MSLTFLHQFFFSIRKIGNIVFSFVVGKPVTILVASLSLLLDAVIVQRLSFAFSNAHYYFLELVKAQKSITITIKISRSVSLSEKTQRIPFRSLPEHISTSQLGRTATMPCVWFQSSNKIQKIPEGEAALIT